MIELTQLNGACVYVNSDLIETFESTPDTVISLTTGRKLIVRETPEEVVKLVMEFAAKVSSHAAFAGEGAA